MAKQNWQVTGMGTDGQSKAITISSETRESAMATARKNGLASVTGVELVSPSLPYTAPPQTAAELNAGLFPPVTVENISFGATVKIGVGVFIGVTLASAVVGVILYLLGWMATR